MSASAPSILVTLLPCCFPSARRRRADARSEHDENTPLLNGQRHGAGSTDSAIGGAGGAQGDVAAPPQATYDAEVLKHIVAAVQHSFLPLSRASPGISGSGPPASNVSAAGGSSSAPQSRDHSVDTAPMDPQAQAITDLYVRALRSKSKPVGSLRAARTSGAAAAAVGEASISTAEGAEDSARKRTRAAAEGSRKSRRTATARPLTLVRSMNFNLPTEDGAGASSSSVASSSAAPAVPPHGSHLTGHRLVDLWNPSRAEEPAAPAPALAPDEGDAVLEQSTSTLTLARQDADSTASVHSMQTPTAAPHTQTLPDLETRMLDALRRTEARVGRLHTREEWGRGEGSTGSESDDEGRRADALEDGEATAEVEEDRSVVERAEAEKGTAPGSRRTAGAERERDLERDKEKVTAGRTRRRNTLMLDADGKTVR